MLFSRDLIEKISSYLTPEDIAHWSMANKYYNEKIRNSGVCSRSIESTFLHHCQKI